MGATFAAQASCVVMVAQRSTLRSTPVPLWVGTSVCIITVIDRKPIFAYFSNKEKGPKTMNIKPYNIPDSELPRHNGRKWSKILFLKFIMIQLSM